MNYQQKKLQEKNENVIIDDKNIKEIERIYEIIK